MLESKAFSSSGLNGIGTVYSCPNCQDIEVLMSLMIRKRFDLEFSVGKMSQFWERSTSLHWSSENRDLIH